MKFILAACLAGSLLLAGCASTTGTASSPSTTPDTASTASAASSTAAVPVYPGGPLTPITSGTTRSRSVVTLAAPADMWDRIRRGFKMPDLDSELVRDREQWYASRPDYMQRMTERSSRYIFHIVEELERRDMPTELALQIGRAHV